MHGDGHQWKMTPPIEVEHTAVSMAGCSKTVQNEHATLYAAALHTAG